VAPPKKKNPWITPGEVLLWLLFVALIFPAAFAGYAVGHYTSLGKPPKTVQVTTTVGLTSTPTTTSTPATTTTSAATTTTTSSSGGNAAAGKVVFASSSCATCHTFAPAGSTGVIGPNLDTAPKKDATADGNMDLDAFIKESITDPNAYIAIGYTKPSAMPPEGGASLTPKQLADLVAFISSGQQ
jgi:mono/diheme cytochrome c family protein